MPFITVNSVDDPALDIFVRFTEAQLKNRLDPDNALFIAESPNVIRTALDVGLEPVSLLCESKHLDGDGADIVKRVGDIPVYVAERELFSALTGYALTRGMHCVMRRPKPLTPETLLTSSRRVAVLENIVDAVNIGSIFRSAAALNVDAVFLTPSCADPLVRRTVRVSMGAVFQVPWAFMPEEVADTGLFSTHGFKTVAMALSKNSVWIDDKGLKKEDKLAIVLGTEGTGLKPDTVSACDYVAKIPMHNGVDSLNVAAAATLAFWELRI